jgi:hypothetical protein
MIYINGKQLMTVGEYRGWCLRLLKQDRQPGRRVWYRHIIAAERTAFGGTTVPAYGKITPVRAFPYHVLFRKERGGMVSYTYPEALQILRGGCHE